MYTVGTNDEEEDEDEVEDDEDEKNWDKLGKIEDKREKTLRWGFRVGVGVLLGVRIKFMKNNLHVKYEHNRQQNSDDYDSKNVILEVR
ncbi:hypothetical protein M0802_011500 [Mischocyttarus mexicanus]|nr:hypothetical protein M0802_011500 [Mischocyttarus mexicanus]